MIIAAQIYDKKIKDWNSLYAVKDLNLGYFGLNKLPEKIGTLAQLVRLDLNNNKLSCLP